MAFQKTIMLVASFSIGIGSALGCETNTNMYDSEYSMMEDSLLIFHIYDDGLYNKNWENKKRDLSAINILPTVSFNNGALTFEGVRTIDNLEYQILDAEENSVLEGTLTIEAHKTQTIELPNLPAGTYLLVLTICDESFAGEFEI